MHRQLGLSLTDYPVPVTQVMAQSPPWTLGLAGLATVISFTLGTGLGIYIAWRRDSVLDNILPTVTTFTSAIRYF